MPIPLECGGRRRFPFFCLFSLTVRSRQKDFPKVLTLSNPERMNTEAIRVVRVERVDDLPVLLATMRRLRIAEMLDRHYPAHHLWGGALTPGEVVCVWLTFLLSEGDHRLYKLQPWSERTLLNLR